MSDYIDVLAVMDSAAMVLDDRAWTSMEQARAAVAELIETLEYALRESGCDGDLCMHFWHERARKIIDKVRRP